MNNPTVTVVAAWVTVAAHGVAWLLTAHHPRVPRRWRFVGAALWWAVVLLFAVRIAERLGGG